MRNDYAPEGGSPGHSSWSKTISTTPSAYYRAYQLAATQLGAAEDHLVALEVLLAHSTTTIAPYVLARAAVEACGRAFLLMDPAISDTARSELAVAERLEELKTLR